MLSPFFRPSQNFRRISVCLHLVGHAYSWVCPSAYVTIQVRPGTPLQLGHLADTVSGRWSGSDEVSLRHKYETPLSMAIATRRASFGRRQQQQEPLHESQSKGAGIARCGLWQATSAEVLVRAP